MSNNASKEYRTYLHYTEDMPRKEAMKQRQTNQGLWEHFDRYSDDCIDYLGESAKDCASRYARNFA